MVPRGVAGRRGRFALGALLLALLPAGVAQGESHESVSGQTQACGWGSWADGSERTFQHQVTYTIVVDSERGYVVDCYNGTDAYFEFRGTLPGGLLVYAVWGQLGDYQ